MHETTRRAIARLLFVLFCALPTGMTAALILLISTPWYADHRRAALETELAKRLGLGVTIEALEHPSPGTTRLVGVTLHERETRAEVGRVRLVTWTEVDEKTVIWLSQPELRSEHLDGVWRIIHDRFLCQPELTDHPVRVTADALTIHSRSGSATLRKVDAWLRPGDHRVEAMIQCVPAGRRDDAPIHVTVIRDRSGKVAATDWTLHTGDLALPCSPLADYLPLMKQLGPEATFTGTLRWRLSTEGWSIDLGGSRFDDIELSDLLHNVPHRLTGRAAVRFERAQIDPGKAADVSGTLIAGGGYVGWSLIRAAGTQLGFDFAPPGENDIRDLNYDRIALRFDLFGPQLSLTGICHQMRGFEYLTPGVVVAAGGRGLVGSGGEPQSWASMVRMFWQDGRETLPASGQSAWLMSWLPAPRMVTPTPPIPPRITGTTTFGGGPLIQAP